MAKDENRLAANHNKSLPAESSASDEQAVEAYLDRLCGQLKSLPPAQRDEIRREVQAHLELLIARQGDAPHAVQTALTQFGEAEAVGRDWAQRTRRDHWRLWWRGLRWQVRLVLFSLLLIGGWGAAITIEFCRWMQWGHAFGAWFIIGPMAPLLLGWLWGIRSKPTRYGYVLIGAIACVIVAFLPIPGQFAQADMDSIGSMDLSVLVRLTYVIMWWWIACATCGVARIFRQSPDVEKASATA